MASGNVRGDGGHNVKAESTLQANFAKIPSPLCSAELHCPLRAFVALGFGQLTGAQDPHKRFGKDDAEWTRWRMGELCTEEGVYFTGSGNCVNCHAPDANGHALVDEMAQPSAQLRTGKPR